MDYTIQVEESKDFDGGAGKGCNRSRHWQNCLSLNKERQYVFFAILSLTAICSAALILPSSDVYFRRYFGGINPILVVASAAVIGGFSLALLQSIRGFVILRGRATLRGMAVSAGMATALAVAITVADFFIRYPEDMNVPVPQALVFYPVVGFVAEMAFHVAPLTLVLLAMAPLCRRLGTDRLVWVAFAVAGVIEPTFQVVFAGEPLSWASAYTWVHVSAIAFLQLYVFLRYDFVSMYSFRLIYYAYWHIIWGTIRLEVLF